MRKVLGMFFLLSFSFSAWGACVEHGGQVSGCIPLSHLVYGNDDIGYFRNEHQANNAQKNHYIATISTCPDCYDMGVKYEDYTYTHGLCTGTQASGTNIQKTAQNGVGRNFSSFPTSATLYHYPVHIHGYGPRSCSNPDPSQSTYHETNAGMVSAVAICPANYEPRRDTTQNSTYPYGYLCHPLVATTPTTVKSDYPNKDCADSNTLSSQTTQNPVDIHTRCRNEQVVDLRVEAPFPLIWSRFAQQDAKYESWNMEGVRNIGVSPVFTSGTYSGKHLASIRRRNGSSLFYTAPPSSSAARIWTPVDPQTDSVLEELYMSGTTGWILHQRNGEKEIFDANGKLVRRASMDGFFHHYFYETTDGKNVLKEIRDDFGHVLSLSYQGVFDTTTFPENEEEEIPHATSTQQLLPYGLPSQVATPHRTVKYEWFNKPESSSNAVLGQLVAVEYEDGGIREYIYGESVEGNSSNPYALTGVVDEEGLRERTYKIINGTTKVESEWMGSVLPSQALQRLNITGSKLTDQDGNEFGISDSSSRLGYTKPLKDTTGMVGRYLYKNSTGLVDRVVDWEGNETRMVYDLHNRMTSITIGYGTPLAQTTSYTYSSVSYDRRPKSIVENVRNHEGLLKTRTTTFTYNDIPVSYPATSPCMGAFGGTTVPCASTKNVLTSITISLNDGSPSRTYTLTYNSLGLKETLVFPTGKVVKWAYGLNGLVTSITEGFGTPLAQTTYMGGYTSFGPSWIKQPNGLVTRFLRDAKGRIIHEDTGIPSNPSNDTSIGTVTDDQFVLGGGGLWRTTSFVWHKNNLLNYAVLPNANKVFMTYDPARRVTQVQVKDASNNIVSTKNMTYSPAGSLLSEILKNETGTTELSFSQTFNGLRDVAKVFDANMEDTTLGYNLNGEVLSSTSPLGAFNRHTLDALGRPKTMTDALNNVSSLTYGPQNEILTATDARLLSTQYTFNGFGDLVELESPDRGLWSFIYDSAGQQVTTIDPRNVVTTTSYDLLGRVTQKVFDDGFVSPHASFTSGNHTHTFSYDTCQGFTTQPCSVSDQTGTTNFSYNLFGEILEQEHTGKTGSPLDGVTLTQGYMYDAVGRVIQMTYPSGKILEVGYDSASRISSLSYDNQEFINNIAWTSFNAIKSWQWTGSGIPSAGKSTAFSYDQNGNPLKIEDVDTRDYVLDEDHRIVAVDDPLDVTKSQVYSYDLLGQLKEVDVGAWFTPLLYNYDPVGNRTSQLDNAQNGFIYNVGSLNNRLLGKTVKTAGVSGAEALFTYDAMGSIATSPNNHAFSYDVEARLAKHSQGTSQTSYLYNALGQRVSKQHLLNTILYNSNLSHQRLGEYKKDPGKPNGVEVISEFVYLDGFRIVGVVKPSSSLGMNSPVIYPILSDHLGTPRKVLDPASGFTVWSWDAKHPFGAQAPNENPSSVGNFIFDARFPGQWFDEESGLFHNMFRDYMPENGRYLQSDPLGLEAGWNTYSYVGSNPMSGVDPWGLILVEPEDNTPEAVAYRDSIQKARKSPVFNRMYNNLKNSKLTFAINVSFQAPLNQYGEWSENGAPIGGTVYWNPTISIDCGLNANRRRHHPTQGLIHEMIHAHNTHIRALAGAPTPTKFFEEKIWNLPYERKIFDELGMSKGRTIFEYYMTTDEVNK